MSPDQKHTSSSKHGPSSKRGPEAEHGPEADTPPRSPRAKSDLTAESLKVLAHPLRSQLLSALRRGGPATATALAAELRTNTGATSYHLRKLADVDLVTDTGEGEGRRRLWQASTGLTSWEPSTFADDEDAVTALNWLGREHLRHFVDQQTRWLDVAATWPGEWQDATATSDDLVLLDAGEALALREELWEVVQRYRAIATEGTDASGDSPRSPADPDHPDRRRVGVHLHLVPIDLADEPGQPADDEPRR